MADSDKSDTSINARMRALEFKQGLDGQTIEDQAGMIETLMKGKNLWHKLTFFAIIAMIVAEAQEANTYAQSQISSQLESSRQVETIRAEMQQSVDGLRKDLYAARVEQSDKVQELMAEATKQRTEHIREISDMNSRWTEWTHVILEKWEKEQEAKIEDAVERAFKRYHDDTDSRNRGIDPGVFPGTN